MNSIHLIIKLKYTRQIHQCIRYQRQTTFFLLQQHSTTVECLTYFFFVGFYEITTNKWHYFFFFIFGAIILIISNKLFLQFLEKVLKTKLISADQGDKISWSSTVDLKICIEMQQRHHNLLEHSFSCCTVYLMFFNKISASPAKQPRMVLSYYAIIEEIS